MLESADDRRAVTVIGEPSVTGFGEADRLTLGVVGVVPPPSSSVISPAPTTGYLPGGETEVREPYDELVHGDRRAAPAGPAPRPRRVFRGRRAEFETLRGLRAFASGADPAWTA